MSAPHKFTRNLNLGIALGGGGARGLAHVGVLKILEQAGILPNVVVGTSMGSIVGALYCSLRNAQLTEEIILRQLQDPKMNDLGLNKFQQEESREFFQRNIQKTLEQLTRFYMLTSVLTQDHIITEEKVKTLLTLLLPTGNIEDLPLRFGAVAADLLQGQPYLFQQGPITLATQASAAIPGVFPPVLHDSKQLVDGGIVALVPVDATRSIGANIVIAVDVSPFSPANKLYQTGIDIWMRSDQITGKTLCENQLKNADIVIQVNLLDYEWHAFSSAKNIMLAGEHAAQAALPQILEILRSKLPWWRRWLPVMT